MNNHYLGKAYELLLQELKLWIWHNDKLRNAITPHNLEYLFEFHKQRGLSIDLRRFEPDYYRAVFYPPEEKRVFIDEFVRKVCIVIKKNLSRTGKTDMTLTITVRHMVSEVSYWRTCYIDQQHHEQKAAPLTKKEQDWFYSFDPKQKGV